MKKYIVLFFAFVISFFSQILLAQTITDQLIFYKKNGCKGDVASTQITYKPGKYNCKKKFMCQNDEARSVFVQSNVHLPIVIAVFDDPNGSFSDDYSFIRIWKKSQSMKTGTGVCIPSFEANYGKSWMSINWNHGNGLDGKVSRIEISRN